MRKSVLALYLVLTAVILGFFIFFQEKLETEARTFIINKVSPFQIDDKILVVSGQMYLELYNELLKKAAQTENSVMIMLPQLFNIKFDYYLEDMNPEAAVNAKRAYSELAETLAEGERLLPVVYVSKEGGKDRGEISSQYFSETKPSGINPVKFTDAKSYATRMFKTSRAATFFVNYTSYPAAVPLIFSYEGKYYLSAPLEAVRRYYKLIKTKIKFESGIMRAGDIISVPVDGRGFLMLPPVSKEIETITPQEFLAMPKTAVENKIIIVRGLSQTKETLYSLAASISSILNSRAIVNRQFFDFLAVLSAAALILINYRLGIWRLLSFVFLLTAGLWTLSIWLATKDTVSLPVTQTFAVLFSFCTVLYFRAAARSADIQRRRSALLKHVDAASAERMIRKNSDIMLLNSRKKAWLITVICPPDAVKKTFEKVLLCLYNEQNDHLTVINGDGSITSALFDDDYTNVKSAIESALRIKEAGYPVLLRREEVNVSFQNGSFMIFGGNRETPASFIKFILGNNNNANVYVPGYEIQNYIGVTKFQKANSSGEEFFAITGQREELR